MLTDKKQKVTISDGEMQKRVEKDHPYVFNLEGGNYFTSYQEAVEALMTRDLNGIQNNEPKILFSFLKITFQEWQEL